MNSTTTSTSEGTEGTESTGEVGCHPDPYDSSGSFIGHLPSMELGSGFNGFNQTVAGHCLDLPEAPSCNVNQKKEEKKISFSSTAAELRESLGIAAGASFGAGLWETEASAAFFSSTHVTSTSAYLVIDVSVQLSPQSIGAVTLTADKESLLAEDPELFVISCGDQFVDSVTGGGVYRVIYRFMEQSETTKSELKAEFAANGLDWSVNGGLQQSLEAASSRFATEVYVLQQGGVFEQSDLTPKTFIEKANGFAAEIDCENASPTSVSTKSYYSVQNLPAGLRYPNAAVQHKEQDALALVYDKARVLRNDILERLDHPGRLLLDECAGEKAKYQAKLDELDAYLAAAEDKFDACTTAPLCGPTDACLAPLQPPVLEFPKLSDPALCGPLCTDGVGSTYASDDYGYCTRCTWEPQAANVPKAGGVKFLQNECRYLRRGAKVLVRASGVFDPNSPYDAWPIFRLIATSGNTGSDCDGPDCSFSFGTITKPTPFAFKQSFGVSPTDPLAAVQAYLLQDMCQKSWDDAPCVYKNVVFDICDVNNPDGCSWLFRVSSGKPPLIVRPQPDIVRGRRGERRSHPGIVRGSGIRAPCT